MGAWAASMATTSEGVATWLTETAIAARTPGASVIVVVAPAESGTARSTRASPPVTYAAWSAADLVQLWCCASASVPVATAITSSSAAPPWRSGWRLNCQPASAEVSPRPAADTRSTARAAAGSSRSVRTVPPASASAGASTRTGSMADGPLADVETAEYRRSCQQASTASAISARSAPALVAPESTACLPRRTWAAPRPGRSTG